MRPRIDQELALLRQFYPAIQHNQTEGGDWFLLPEYAVPSGWRINEKAITQAQLCFFAGAGYPSSPPYAFLMPEGINFNGAQPGNTTSAAPPFGGTWLQFSWSPETWFPEADVRKGSNLLAWVRSFLDRLKEGE